MILNIKIYKTITMTIVILMLFQIDIELLFTMNYSQSR